MWATFPALKANCAFVKGDDVRSSLQEIIYIVIWLWAKWTLTREASKWQKATLMTYGHACRNHTSYIRKMKLTIYASGRKDRQ